MGGTASKADAIEHSFAGEKIKPQADFIGLEFDAEPFAHGSCRETYRGRIISSETEQTIISVGHAGDWTPIVVDGHKRYPCVVKMFKKEHVYQASQWNQDLAALTQSKELADLFNREFDGKVKRKITFAKAMLFKVVEPGSTEHVGRRSVLASTTSLGAGVGLRFLVATAAPEALPLVWLGSGLLSLVSGVVGMNTAPARVKEQEFVCAEPFLEGRFIKVNSNSGHCNLSFF